MLPPAVPPDELQRLETLRALRLLDTPAEFEFDAIARLGRRLFRLPICLVTFVDANRQWFKAREGMSVSETDRAVSFCGHAILKRELFLVFDATKDERFHDNPLVVGPPFIRFYAGAPIALPNGHAVGTVCVMDTRPRESFDPEEASDLVALSDLALTAILARATRLSEEDSRMDAERYLKALSLTPTAIGLADADGVVTAANEAFAKFCGVAVPKGSTMRDLVTPDHWPNAGPADGSSLPLAHRPGRLRAVKDSGGYVLLGSAV